jgi:hypothetical protein
MSLGEIEEKDARVNGAMPNRNEMRTPEKSTSVSSIMRFLVFSQEVDGVTALRLKLVSN